MDFPKQHLGHSYGPAPTNSQLGISSQINSSEAIDDHIVVAVKKLLADGYKGQDLWNILTALRGPDNGDNLLKEATTAVLRHKLWLDEWSIGLFASNPDEQALLEIRKQIDVGENSHFTRHIMAAFKSIGLNWNGVNE